METKTLIVGGGITGLSAASFLPHSDYLVLEKDSTPGGYCKTTIRGEYTWDYSGHFFHFNSSEIKDYVLENMESEMLQVTKITDIDYNKNIIDFPFQFNIDQLPEEEYKECLADLDNLGEADLTTFKSFVRSTLGKGICDKFIIPYNEKLYACNLDELEYDSMGRFFPKSKSKSYNDTFIYPKGGSYEYIKSVLKRVDSSKILLNTQLLELDLENKIAKTTKGDIKFQQLISTLPFNKINPNPKLSANKVAVFNLGFDKGSPIKTHWRYFPGSEVFYRVGFYNNILGQEKLSLYVEVGLTKHQPVDSNVLLEQVLADLKKCNIITDQQLVEHQFLTMNPAYVHITKESKQIYSEWCQKYNPKGIYSIGRYGSWTYCSIEDNIIEAKHTIQLYDAVKIEGP
jgi:protoporphyrinogen oxidase